MPATTPLRVVRQVCTAPEAELVRASRDKASADLAPARLRSKVARARTLRDKFRSLAERQRREQRGKSSPRGREPAAGNDRTIVKQTIFAEALERFERLLARAERTGNRAANANGQKKAGRKPTKNPEAKPTRAEALAARSGGRMAAGGTGGTPRRAARSVLTPTLMPRGEGAASNRAAAVASRRATKAEAALGSIVQAGFAQTGRVRHLGHVSSRNRRDQGKRDSRG